MKSPSDDPFEPPEELDDANVVKVPEDRRTFVTGDELYEVLHDVSGVLSDRGASELSHAVTRFLDDVKAQHARVRPGSR